MNELRRIRELIEESRRRIDTTLPVVSASTSLFCLVGIGGISAFLSSRQQRVLRRTASALRRAEADAETARRVAQRDVESSKHYATQRFAKDILEVADSLRLARKSIEKLQIKSEHYALVEGYELLANQLDSALAKNGVHPFGQVGELFDPSKHEAIASIKNNNETNHSLFIDQVDSVGFQLNGRVIRAAAVTVSSSPPQVASDSSSNPHSESQNEQNKDKDGTLQNTERSQGEKS